VTDFEGGQPVNPNDYLKAIETHQEVLAQRCRDKPDKDFMEKVAKLEELHKNLVALQALSVEERQKQLPRLFGEFAALAVVPQWDDLEHVSPQEYTDLPTFVRVVGMVKNMFLRATESGAESAGLSTIPHAPSGGCPSKAEDRAGIQEK
jgi:hypothetical protein